jgi:ribosomal protein S27AE
MKIRMCSQCGKQNDENVWNCVNCGATLSINTLVNIEDNQSSQAKAKICPQCGKQNDEKAWNCVDCGATLSINTIVNINGLQNSQIAIAGKGLLSSVSPYFQEDLTYLLYNTIKENESIAKGCDICKPSILPPFKFGYLIITSQQLICVRFKSDTELYLRRGWFPKRPWLRRYLGEFVEGLEEDPLGAGLWAKFCFVDRPSSELTSTEKSSRELVLFPLDKLYSTELVDDLFLNLKFNRDDGTLNEFSLTFYFNDEAFEIQRLLGTHLKQK